MINKAATEDSFEDPANDRVVKEVLPPPMFNLSHSTTLSSFQRKALLTINF